MSKAYPILGDIWPYKEAAAAPELASLPVSVFFSDSKNSPVKAATWVSPADPSSAPRASYALRVRRAGGRADLSRWNPVRGVWIVTHRFLVPETDETCAIVELGGVLLGNVSTSEALGIRMKSLLQAELSEAKYLRFAAKVLSVASIIVLFFAVRSGVESNAIEPFALIFTMAVGIGLLAVGLRTRTKVLGEQGLQRLHEQFQFEYRKADHGNLSLKTVTGLLQENERKREEEAVIFGFLLLLCFVYFVSPLVVIGVIVALIIVTIITGDPGMLRVLSVAQDRSERRLEQAMLSVRASDDALAPVRLRKAKKEVLRDRIRRYGDMTGRVRETQTRTRLSTDIAIAVAFLIIFAAYAFPIAAGFQKLAVSKADSLVNTSLFKVAPVIILLSISKSTVTLAQVLSRRLRAMSK